MSVMEWIAIALGVVGVAVGFLTFGGWGRIARNLDPLGRIARGIGVLLLSSYLFLTVLTDESGHEYWLWVSVVVFMAGLGLIVTTARRALVIPDPTREES